MVIHPKANGQNKLDSMGLKNLNTNFGEQGGGDGSGRNWGKEMNMIIYTICNSQKIN